MSRGFGTSGFQAERPTRSAWHPGAGSCIYRPSVPDGVARARAR
jgi:hypothetical protein